MGGGVKKKELNYYFCKPRTSIFVDAAMALSRGVREGSAFEAACQLALKHLGMSLHVRGGAGDGGIDLVGRWRLPQPRMQSYNSIELEIDAKKMDMISKPPRNKNQKSPPSGILAKSRTSVEVDHRLLAEPKKIRSLEARALAAAAAHAAHANSNSVEVRTTLKSPSQLVSIPQDLSSSTSLLESASFGDRELNMHHQQLARVIRVGVQCKSFQSAKISVSTIRELEGSLAVLSGLHAGLVCAHSGYTSAAVNLCRRSDLPLGLLSFNGPECKHLTFCFINNAMRSLLPLLQVSEQRPTSSSCGRARILYDGVPFSCL